MPETFTPARRVIPVHPDLIDSARRQEQADRARRAADRRTKAIREAVALDRDYRQYPQS